MLGVDESALLTLALLAIGSLVALAVIARPLIFASLQSELAEARGVPLRFVSVAFLAIVARGGRRMRADRRRTARVHPDGRPGGGGDEPYARARRSASRSPPALALAEAWGGLTLAFYTDWPTSFWITALSGIVFFGAAAERRFAG